MRKEQFKKPTYEFYNIIIKKITKPILFFFLILIVSLNACSGGNNLNLLFEDPVKIPTVSVSSDITPFTGGLTALGNYNYHDASAHLTYGPGSDIYVSKIYFYEGSDGLHLFFHHNIHGEGETNTVKWTITIWGNNLQDSVILSDDGGELTLVSTDSTNKTNTYEGDWWYSNRTDGGIIGPFINPDFTIKVELKDVGNVTNSLLYSANGETFDLEDEFLIVY